MTRVKKLALQLTGLATAIVAGLCPQLASAQCNCGGSPVAGNIIYGSAMPVEMGIPMGEPPLPEGGIVIEADSIYLTVKVPEKAVLTINGDPTISVGEMRYFVVKGLDVEREYNFVIVAETANAAGVAMEETKTVKLSPGKSELVQLKPVKRKVVKPAAPEEPPADADAAADADA